MTQPCLIVAILALIVPTAYAEEQASSAAPVAEAEAATEPDAEESLTVVTAPAQSGAAFDRERSSYTLDAATLEARQVIDGVEAAASVPGVSLQRTNRGAGTPLIRGFVGPQNLVFVDDVRFDLSTFRTGPNQYAALADPLGLDALTVTLGPGAVLWGAGAMGGVLRYRTAPLTEAEGISGKVIGRLASADSGYDGALEMGGRTGVFAGSLGASVRHHDLLRTGQGGKAPMSAFGAASWRGKAEVALGQGWLLQSAYLATRVRNASRTDKLGRGEVRVYDNDDHLAYLQVRKEASEGWLRDLRLTLSYHHLWDRVSRYNCARELDGTPANQSACVELSPSTITRTREFVDVVNALGLRASAEMRWLDERLVLRSGLEGRLELVGSEGLDSSKPDPVRGTFSEGSLYAGADVFAHLEGRPYVSPGVFELVLSGGARLSTTIASAQEVPGLGNVDYLLVTPAFSAGVRALLWNQLNLFATFHEGVRAPNLQETTALGDTGNFFEVPNDALGPERADSIEVGIRAHLGWLRAEAVYFHTWMSDAIVREEVSGDAYPEAADATVMQRINADSAEIDGVEIGLSTGDLAGFSLFGDVAWLQSDVTFADGTSEPGRRVPPLQGRAGLRWEGGEHAFAFVAALRWAAAQERLSSGDRKDLRICEDPARPGVSLGEACEGTPGWATIDLRAGVTPRDGMRLELALHNVLDVNYRDHGSGFDAPGIDLRMSLRQAF